MVAAHAREGGAAGRQAGAGAGGGVAGVGLLRRKDALTGSRRGIELEQFDPLAALVVRNATARALWTLRLLRLGPLVALLGAKGETGDAIGRLRVGASGEGKQTNCQR